ncbi:MAG: glutaredoxin [Bacteroidetes bacterium]|nr:glutaredoxin [Bacteroidota bacterium]
MVMIEIYGTSRCDYCKKAVALAESYKLKYEYKDAKDLDIYEQLLGKIGSVPTVPQIFWNDKHIGGYESFSLEIENTREYGQDGF